MFRIFAFIGILLGMSAGVSASEAPLRIALVGDIMLGSTYPNAHLPPVEGRRMLTAARPVLLKTDLALGNLEGTIGQSGQSTKKGCLKCFAFRSPPWAAKTLAWAGFDGVSQANNHARDFGEAGLKQSAYWLDRFHIQHTGPLNQKSAVWYRHGQKICFLAFAPNAGMHDIRQIKRAQHWIAHVKKNQQCHWLIVAFHGGGEGASYMHTPRGEQDYLGENRGNVRRFAHAAVEGGADLVFGQGPHVVRGLELFHHHLIAYSLGNFATETPIVVGGPMGWAPLLEVTLDSKGRLVHGQIVSFLQTPDRILKPDPRQRAAKAIRRLTESDFQGGRLHFVGPDHFTPR